MTYRRLTCCMLFCVIVLPALTGRSDDVTSRVAGRLIDEVGVTPQLGGQVPLDLSFVDDGGREVRLGDCISDRPVILHLVYYQCPMLCKLSSDGLFRAVPKMSLKLGEEFSIVTLSFDPREGPELSARAKHSAFDRCGREGVESGWRFLTGQEPAIAELCRSVGFRYKFDSSTRQYAHAAGVFVLTSDGRVSRYLSGVEYSPRDLRLALVEASAGKVGTVADQVLLMCYMYDPTAGKYGLAIMTAVRAAGVLTVATLAIAIMVMLRRERSRELIAGQIDAIKTGPA
ncbi:MAG: SCO family protein [Pirellulales bacterium]